MKKSFFSDVAGHVSHIIQPANKFISNIICKKVKIADSIISEGRNPGEYFVVCTGKKHKTGFDTFFKPGL